jgi:hypothetical protein
VLCLIKEEKTLMNTVDACNKQKNNFRELHYPISMQNEDKRMIAMIRYEESKREEKFAYHLGTFYSTASYVFYYLMRLGPFMRSLIKLQNGAQENPNRMFDSLKDTQEILDNSTDNRELIPEFFACVEFLLNLNCSFFGVKYGNKVVDDVTFQHGNSLAKYIQFVLAHRKLLNSTRISSHIRCWIDYTYGVNQLSSDATSCTVFSVNSYAQKVKLNDKLMKMKHKSAKYNNGVIDYASVYNKMNDKVLIILNFGQAPFQVFTSKHPNRNEHQSGNDDEYDDDKGHQTNSENTLVDDYELLGKLIHYISQKIKVKGVSDIVCGRYYVHSASYDKMCFITCNGVIAVCKEIPLRQTYENDNVDVYKLQGFHLENPKMPSPKIEGTILCHYISHNETLFNLSLYFNSYKTSTDISQVISAPSNIKAFYERIDKSLHDIDSHNYSCSYEQFYIEGNFAFVLKLVTNVSITIGLVGTNDNNGDLRLKDGQCFVIKVSDAKISDKDLNLNITIRNVKISWNEFVVVAVLSDSNEVYPNEVNRFIVRKTNVQGKLMVICESKFDKQITLQETKLVLKLRRKFLSKVFKIVNKNYEKQKHKNYIP